MTQIERIDKYIKDFGSITGYECVVDLGVLKFSARLTEMSRRDFPLKSKWERSKNRYGQPVRYKRYYYDESAIQERNPAGV